MTQQQYRDSSSINNGLLYKDAEHPTATQMMVWINAQIARHHSNWRLIEVVTDKMNGTHYWSGLIFEPLKAEEVQ